MYFGSTYDTHIDLNAREIILKNLKNQPLLWPKTSPTIHLLHRNVCDEFLNICLKNRSFIVKKAYDILKNWFWRPWVRILRVNENPKPEY